MSFPDQPLAFVDIETTGGSYYNSRVIEVAVHRVEQNKLVRTYHTLLDPGSSIPSQITQLTGLRNEDIISAPTFRTIADELLEILDGCLFVAHNVRFDYSFLKNEFKRCGYEFAPKQLCTVRLSRTLFPEYKKHNLSEIINRFGISISDRHRAYDDAKALWEFYKIVLREFDLETIEAAFKQQFKHQALPANVSPSMIDALPDAPGVYIFEGENGAPLYVGKSVNIRQRVLSHFNQDHARYTELKIAQQLTGIKHVRTHGELGALILESQMVKQILPLHNRRLRKSKGMSAILRTEGGGGYYGIRVVKDGRIKATELSNILGVYKTYGQAKKALQLVRKEHFLCPKLLGLETGKGMCFQSQIQGCFGACAGKEFYLKYNMRFIKAFSRTRLKNWPFKSAIIVTEKHPDLEGFSSYVFKNWCYVGEFKENIDELRTAEPQVFDKDMYQILSQYIAKPNNRHRIKDLPLLSAAAY